MGLNCDFDPALPPSSMRYVCRIIVHPISGYHIAQASPERAAPSQRATCGPQAWQCSDGSVPQPLFVRTGRQVQRKAVLNSSARAWASFAASSDCALAPTPSEKKYMRALAEFGHGKHRSGDIAEQLGVKVTSVAPTRNALIKKGMVYSPSHGDTAFTVPLFDQFMRRTMPGVMRNPLA
jgi:hypothetical protein